MTGVIDRFEGEYAVVELENGNMINVAKKKIPSEAKEGCVINIADVITINYEETKAREKRIKKLMEDIWE